MPLTVLEREMYTEAAAARLLGVAQSTLNYWLEGGERRGKIYRPVNRAEPRGSRAAVTWGEFVEAGLLREYRRRSVPMLELRTFIDMIRDEYGVPYPLADQRPYVGGKRLLVEAQAEAGLKAEFALIAAVGSQLVLTPTAQAFYERVTWEDDTAAAWRPHDDRLSPVRMNPRIRFGLPAVAGIRTEILREHSDAGETDEDIAEEFDLPIDSVRWALAYEVSARTRAA
jgi:uncharacterized protein (DUF433 family)